MRLFIDGDAFPNLLKPIILRAIEKQKLDTIVIANKKENTKQNSLISITYYNIIFHSTRINRACIDPQPTDLLNFQSQYRILVMQ